MYGSSKLTVQWYGDRRRGQIKVILHQHLTSLNDKREWTQLCNQGALLQLWDIYIIFSLVFDMELSIKVSFNHLDFRYVITIEKHVINISQQHNNGRRFYFESTWEWEEQQWRFVIVWHIVCHIIQKLMFWQLVMT